MTRHLGVCTCMHTDFERGHGDGQGSSSGSRRHCGLGWIGEGEEFEVVMEMRVYMQTKLARPAAFI